MIYIYIFFFSRRMKDLAAASPVAAAAVRHPMLPLVRGAKIHHLQPVEHLAALPRVLQQKIVPRQQLWYQN